MARYRKVDVRMWRDERFRRLSVPNPNGRECWQFLLTNPHTSNIPGLYAAYPETLAAELRWSTEGFLKAFGEPFREGLAKADWKAGLVFIPNAIRYNEPENPNVVKGWRVTWDELPECSLKREAFRYLKAYLEGLGEGFAKPFVEGCGKGMANQEQEQEQEQEHEQEQTQPELALGGKPVSDFGQVVELWQSLWLKRYQPTDGKKPQMTAADRGQVSLLLKRHGLAGLLVYVQRFMADNDSFLSKRAHHLCDLTQKIDSYRSSKASTTTGYSPASDAHNEQTEDITEKL